MRIVISFFTSERIQRKLDVPENITIEELRDEFFPRIGLSNYRGPLFIIRNWKEKEIFGGRLSDYDIKDGNLIFVPSEMRGEGGEIENESTHICPYGCGRQVPNEFKGCTELLQARPNYYG